MSLPFGKCHTICANSARWPQWKPEPRRLPQPCWLSTQCPPWDREYWFPVAKTDFVVRSKWQSRIDTVQTIWGTLAVLNNKGGIRGGRRGRIRQGAARVPTLCDPEVWWLNENPEETKNPRALSAGFFFVVICVWWICWCLASWAVLGEFWPDAGCL